MHKTEKSKVIKIRDKYLYYFVSGRSNQIKVALSRSHSESSGAIVVVKLHLPLGLGL